MEHLVWPVGFWGKLHREPEGLVWHPLIDHCLDVAAVLQALLEKTILRHRLAALGGIEDLTPIQIDRLAWLAFLHDVGKLNIGFQRQTGQGHILPVSALFNVKLLPRTSRALRWDKMEGWFAEPDGLVNLFVASISHHGSPADLDAGNNKYLPLWQPSEKTLDPLAGLEHLTNEGAQQFVPAFQVGAPPFPNVPAFQHGFAGLVSLADWIASDERIFPFSNGQADGRMEFARHRAADALASFGMNPGLARQALKGQDPFVAMGLDFPPNQTQRAVLTLPISSGPSVGLLEATTGSGKTEAAIAHFLRLFAAGEVDGLYFALPTRAAAVQIHRRVHRAAVQAFGAVAPPVLLAVPGYVRVDDAEGRILPGFEVLWPDSDAGLMARRGWAAENPKRYLAGSIVVGTIDQALMGALRMRHAHLRGTALLRHLLVVDEVHASDPYMTGILCRLLELMRDAKGHVLLMSATLGSVAQTPLLDEPALPPPDEAKNRPYPALTLAGLGLMAAPSASTVKRVDLRAVPSMHDPDSCARLAVEAARAGGRILVIRNTVRAAIDTQKALEEATSSYPELLFRCQGIAAPHHSRYGRDDRKLLDAAVETAFGRQSVAAVVLAATQTVEQSLDIDADLLITDLCPADVLLQRIGRLHRHDRGRPSSFTQPRCLVLVPEERDLSAYLTRGRDSLGLSRDRPLAYADLRGIEATWRLVEKIPVWDLPTMNRLLVEEATHPACLQAIAAELGGDWLKHQSILGGVVHGQRSVAQMNGLDRTIPFSDLRPFGDLDGHIMTRLGAGDRMARLPDKPLGPFGHPVPSLSIPGWMAQGIPADAEPTTVGTDPLRVQWGEKRFVYDRLGLRETE